MQQMAEEAVARKTLVFRASQRQEMDALLVRIDRGRQEHRGHWTTSATRLMQAHKNMLSDMLTRQNLELNRAHLTVKTELAPILRHPRSAQDARRAHVKALDSPHILPPPRQRPSRIASATAAERRHSP